MWKLKGSKTIQGINHINRTLLIYYWIGILLAHFIEHDIDKVLRFGAECIFNTSLESEGVNGIPCGKSIGIEAQGISLIVVLYAFSKVKGIGSIGS